MTREKRANLIFILVLIPLILPGFYILMSRRLNATGETLGFAQPVPHTVAYVQPPPVPPGLPRVEPPEAREWVRSILVDHNLSAPPLRTRDDQPVMSRSYRVQAVILQPAEISDPGASSKIQDGRAGESSSYSSSSAGTGNAMLGLLIFSEVSSTGVARIISAETEEGGEATSSNGSDSSKSSKSVSADEPSSWTSATSVEGVPKKLAIVRRAGEVLTVPKEVRRSLQKLGYIDPPSSVIFLRLSLVAPAAAAGVATPNAAGARLGGAFAGLTIELSGTDFPADRITLP